MPREFLRKLAGHVPLWRELLLIIDGLNRNQAETRALRALLAARFEEEELRTNPRYQDPLRLQRRAFQVNSQNGEDGIIAEIFRRIGGTNRVFAEIGVGTGEENNTAFLLSQGWSGYWVDASDAFVPLLHARPDLAQAVKYAVARIDRENAPLQFAQLGVPKEFDLLSLDVDQNTYYVWEALRDYSPRAVVIEYNAAVPPSVDWKVRYSTSRAWDETQNFGASLKALEMLGARLGYRLVGCDFNGINAFFVRQDLAMGKFAEPFTAENHHEPLRYASVGRSGHRAAVLDRG